MIYILTTVLVGTPIRYGQAEPWKATQKKIGRTKQTRTPGRSARAKNDGRPPDTVKELVKKSNARKQRSKNHLKKDDSKAVAFTGNSLLYCLSQRFDNISNAPTLCEIYRPAADAR